MGGHTAVAVLRVPNTVPVAVVRVLNPVPLAVVQDVQQRVAVVWHPTHLYDRGVDLWLHTVDVPCIF